MNEILHISAEKEDEIFTRQQQQSSTALVNNNLFNVEKFSKQNDTAPTH